MFISLILVSLMGSCITKPTYTERLPPEQASGRVEEQPGEPYRVSVAEGARELSASLEDSEDNYSLDSGLRDSMDILREAVRQKATQATIEELGEEMTRLKAAIADLQSTAPREALCMLCESARPRVLLTPCRHLCCCSACALLVSFCPVCIQRITDREEVFLST